MDNNLLARILSEGRNFAQSASNSIASNVSAPVDGLAWAMRKLGAPMPSNPMGGSDWMAEKGLTRPANTNSLSGLLGETMGMAGPMVAAAKAPQIAGGLLRMGENAMVPQALNKQAGVFIGPGAKTWNAGEAARANAMADAGTDARKVWSETGTWKGPDGAWRQEIDDSSAQFVNHFKKPEAKEMQGVFDAQDLVRSTDTLKRDARAAGNFTIPGFYGDKPGLYDKYVDAKNTLSAYESKYVSPSRQSGILEKFVTHDDLYDAYPELSRIPTLHNKGHSGGAYSENARDMLIGGGNEKSIALHEIQHAVQQQEGFARGGMPGIMPDLLNSLAKRKQIEANSLNKLAYSGDPLNVGQILKPGALKRSLDAERTAQNYRAQALRAENFPSFANDAYMRLAGEAEARATQARIPLNAAQRRATFPADSYDVPLDQLIIRGNKP